MGRRLCRTLLLMTLAPLVALSAPSLTRAAAPRLLMVYGTPLPQPVLLTDWWENLDFMLAIAEGVTITPEELAGRPYLGLAFFGGPEWVRYADEGRPLGALRPEEANQHGRFYPAAGDAGAVVTLDSVPGPWPLTRRVEPTGLEILARHGIPTGSPSTSAALAPATGAAPAASASAATPLAVVPASSASPTTAPTHSPVLGWAWVPGGLATLLLGGTAIALRKGRR